MVWIIRILFLATCAIIGWNLQHAQPVVSTLVGLSLGSFFILLEIGFTKKFVSAISVVIFGIIIGFVLSHLFINAMLLIPAVKEIYNQNYLMMQEFEFYITFLFCYFAVTAIIQTKDDFKFTIPFVQLSKDGFGVKPIILDTSVIIDGRISNILQTWMVDVPVIVPRFVLNELQGIADSQDRSRRSRGRRGLDMLNGMKKIPNIKITISDAKIEHIKSVDAKLVSMAKNIGARLVTNDYNLNKVARLQEVEVININDIANAIKPLYLQGEPINIKIIRPGEEHNQGIGYLDDGTMVVVEAGYKHIGEKINCVVTNSLQTQSGRMIFAKPEQSKK